MSHLELVALVVRDDDAAFRFFVDVLQFGLVEDTRRRPTMAGQSAGSSCVLAVPAGILLARPTATISQARSASSSPVASASSSASMISSGDQRMTAAGVRFVSPPRVEPYGRVAVFLDLEGNRWDLLGRDPGGSIAQCVPTRQDTARAPAGRPLRGAPRRSQSPNAFVPL